MGQSCMGMGDTGLFLESCDVTMGGRKEFVCVILFHFPMVKKVREICIHFKTATKVKKKSSLTLLTL